jgi:hypothetical protein
MSNHLQNQPQDQDQPAKKKYTSPTFTNYGKLTELVTSGTTEKQETTGHPDGGKA